MIKLVILKKYSDSSYCWHNLEKKMKISNLSVEKLLSQYQGFEGDLIEMLSIEGDQQKQIIEKSKELHLIPKQARLFVVSSPSSFPNSLKNSMHFVGCDVGICEENKTIYSSVFNEILFGHIPELISQKKKLNENWLFPDILSAEKYIALHDTLANQGEDVEDYEKFTIYEIWEYSTPLFL